VIASARAAAARFWPHAEPADRSYPPHMIWVILAIVFEVTIVAVAIRRDPID
jgi:hypothetical protein